jgi:hypothetical protein
VLSSTVPVHRMCQALLIDFTFSGADLHPDEGPSALKYRACAQNVPDVFHRFYICDAGLHPDEGPSALKYRACAQNVPDVTRRFYILRCWPTPRGGAKCSQVPCLRTECVRHYS